MADTDINVPFPEATDRHLRLTVGACRVKARPGETQAWVAGSYHDPSGRIDVGITQDQGTARITAPKDPADVLGLLEGVPRFDLALGKAQPYALTIESGASENELDLGGLPVVRMTVRHGAGRMTIDFSAPNPQPMSLLSLTSGAGSLECSNLANAGLTELNLEGGAGTYTLDFGGTLQRDGHVKVTTGVSAVEIVVPGTTAARITPETRIGSLDIGDGFTRKEGAFWTEAAVSGKTPVLTIDADVTLGTLRLRTAG